jgi:adenylate cyclase
MFKSHHSRGFLICLAITLLGLFLYLRDAFIPFELKTIDVRFQQRGNRPVNPDICIVTIDEESIAQLGRWPWPRARHAKLIRELNKAGAKVIAFDSLFTEPDKENLVSDNELVQAVEGGGNVVSAFFFKRVEDNLFGSEPLFPFKELEAVSQLGFVNLEPDSDGVTRRAPLVLFEKLENGSIQVHPSLAVSALSLYKDEPVDQLLEKLPLHIDKTDFTHSKNSILVNYAFQKNSPTGYAYPIYSYAEVSQGKFSNGDNFKGKIIFVGATAAALFDLKAIPFISIHPGVMVHANAVDNLLTGNFMQESSPTSTAVYVLIIGLVLGYLLPRLRLWAKLLAFVVVVVGWVMVANWFFVSRQLIVPIVPLLFTAVGCNLGVLFYRLMIEEREKRKIKGSFKQYLSPKIIDVITRDPSKLKLGGEEREVSIFFLDIAGFTTMSEALKPSQLVEVMNHCLTEFSNVILKHDGLINKYIGDCIMAFWNAPADQPRHATQACQAALDCIAVLPSINKNFQERGLPSIDCRIGINTGTVVVGNMGSNERFDYTVMGDPVNLASRLEGANKQYHTHIMVSDETFEKAKDDIEARDLDLIRVKGKKEPRKVFEVLCRKKDMTPELSEGRDRYHLGLHHYRRRNFDEAIETFESVFQYLPNDYLTRIYLERARAFKINPPAPTWDGVFEMQTK